MRGSDNCSRPVGSMRPVLLYVLNNMLIIIFLFHYNFVYVVLLLHFLLLSSECVGYRD